MPCVPVWLHEWISSWKYGNMAVWFTWATAALAITYAAKAAGAARATNNQQAELLKQQAKQLADIEEDKVRSQAEKVAAWFHWQSKRKGDILDPTLGIGASSWAAIAVRNASDIPVYSAVVLIFGVDADAYLGYEIVGLVPPAADPISHACSHKPYFGSYAEGADVSLAFKDAGGRAWARDSDGQLRRLTDLQEFITEAQRLVERDAPRVREITAALEAKHDE